MIAQFSESCGGAQQRPARDQPVVEATVSDQPVTAPAADVLGRALTREVRQGKLKFVDLEVPMFEMKCTVCNVCFVFVVLDRSCFGRT